MRPGVVLILDDGTSWRLGPGDLVGRVPGAALRLTDPRVSEAHAMVSLRGETLRLLALRRPLAIGGQPTGDVELRVGQRIELAAGLAVAVAEVHLPDEIPAIEGAGLPRQVLPATGSLWTRPRPRLVARYEAGADAHVWSSGETWWARVGDQAPRSLVPGDTLVVGDRSFDIVWAPLGDASGRPTELRGAVDQPLRIVARWDTVHLHRDGEPILTLSGVPARILSELCTIGGPVGWEALCAQLWPDGTDRHALRRRLDMGLSRLRRRLQDARVRTDLVRADGTGLIELVPGPGDEVVDET